MSFSLENTKKVSTCFENLSVVSVKVVVNIIN